MNFDIKDMEVELNVLLSEFKSNESFKYNPRSCYEYIFGRCILNINNKKIMLMSIASITNTIVNNHNTLRISPFEKTNSKYIEQALLNECNKGFGERIEKEDSTFVVYLPNMITQQHINNNIQILYKPIIDSYLNIKLKDIRSKNQDKIKSMQAKQRDMFNKYREQINTISEKFIKQCNDFISALEKKYNISINNQK